MMVLSPRVVVLKTAGSSVKLSSFAWLSDGTALKDAEGIAWDSENEGIAAVRADGTVFAVSSGETIIKARLLNSESRSRVIVQIPFSLSQEVDLSESPPPEEEVEEDALDEPEPISAEEPESPPESPEEAPVEEQQETPAETPDEGPVVAEEPQETPPIAENPPESPEEPIQEPPPTEEPTPPEEPMGEPPPSDDSPYADEVVSYVIGPGGGLNEEDLPEIVLGPPRGQGPSQGSFHIFSLGRGGEIVLEFTDYLVFDGEGVDFTVFENAFQIGSDPENTFAEPGIVAVSEDGEDFFEFPCDFEARPYAGCAGVHPTLANPDENEIDPTDPNVSGGDSFDLADVDLTTARFVRIRDSGEIFGPAGGISAGFDLDAVAIVNGTVP